MPSISATRSGSSVSRARMVAAFVVPQIGTTRCPTNPRDAALKRPTSSPTPGTAEPPYAAEHADAYRLERPATSLSAVSAAAAPP